MTEMMLDERSGRILQFIDGDWVSAGEKVPPHVNRRILSMNLLSRNEQKDLSEWELHLDCQHNVIEVCTFWSSPKGWLRDCDSHKHQAGE